MVKYCKYIDAIPVKGSGLQEWGPGCLVREGLWIWRGGGRIFFRGGGLQEGAIWPSPPPFYRYATNVPVASASTEGKKGQPQPFANELTPISSQLLPFL